MKNGAIITMMMFNQDNSDPKLCHAVINPGMVTRPAAVW
jgi:hypothetical protein